MKHRIVVMALTAIVVAALPGRAQAQDVKDTGPDTVVFTPERGKVTFAHGRHAKDFECKSCHHESKQEKPLEKERQKCSSCHTLEPTAPMKTSLRDAMHNTTDREGTCYTCHVKAVADGKTHRSGAPPCQHCEGHHGHSPCVSVCPATATDYDMQTGIVSQVPTRCFGCRYCMAAWPYHVRQFNWWDPIWPDGMERSMNPDVSVRMRGIVEKCGFCYHRYQRALDQAYAEGRRDLKEHEYQTACTQACPAGAIVFGDLNNPAHAVHILSQPDMAHEGKSRNPKAFRLLERLGTNTKVYYLSSKEWVRKAGDSALQKA